MVVLKKGASVRRAFVNLLWNQKRRGHWYFVRRNLQLFDGRKVAGEDKLALLVEGSNIRHWFGGAVKVLDGHDLFEKGDQVRTDRLCRSYKDEKPRQMLVF